MSNGTKDTVEARVAARKAAEDDLRQRLASADMDGPLAFPEGGVFGGVSAFLGGGRDKFAVCLKCGAMVLLNDFAPASDDETKTIERSATLHAQWHEKSQ